jgi:hypothetical protein
MAQNASATEFQVKAVFLTKFASFVKWPDAVFEDQDVPFVIGVMGENPFNGSLEAAVRNEKISGRDLVVRWVSTVEEAKHCQILFIVESDAEGVDAILANLKDQPILTVSDASRFATRGGVVRFVLRNGRVGIEINRRQAVACGLEINPKLLKIATVVD